MQSLQSSIQEMQTCVSKVFSLLERQQESGHKRRRSDPNDNIEIGMYNIVCSLVIL